MRPLRFFISIGICAISLVLYIHFFLKSPIWDKKKKQEYSYLQQSEQNLTPEMKREKRLAEAYWRRYPDVRADPHWGQDSPMGIRGPREHYGQHGKREGRIYGPIIQPSNLVREKQLAEAYWQRYPDIGENKIWGRDGELGVLGARDHFHYYGKAQGRKWGISEKE